MRWQLGFLVWRDQAKLLIGVDVSFAVDDPSAEFEIPGADPFMPPPLEGCLADAPKFRELLIGGQSMRGAWLPRGMAIQTWRGSWVVSPWNCSAVSRQNTACGALVATTMRPSCSEIG